jgi:hypothetical protein
MGPIDNRTLRGINDMAPYKWIGINPSLKRQCGPRLAVFITRIHPFTPEQLTDLHYYLCSIPAAQPLPQTGRRSHRGHSAAAKSIYERSLQE